MMKKEKCISCGAKVIWAVHEDIEKPFDAKPINRTILTTGLDRRERSEWIPTHELHQCPKKSNIMTEQEYKNQLSETEDTQRREGDCR